MPGALNQMVGELQMDPFLRDTHLKLLSTGFLSLLGMLVIFRYF